MVNTFPDGSDDAPSTIIRAFPSSELSEGRPSHHSDAQAGGMAAGGGDGEHGQRIRRVEKEQVYNNIFHGHCRSRSLAPPPPPTRPQRSGGALAPGPNMSNGLAPAQAITAVRSLDETLPSLGYVRENARQEPSPHHGQHCRGRKVSEPREGGYTRLQFFEDDQGPNFGRQQPRTRLSRRLACRP